MGLDENGSSKWNDKTITTTTTTKTTIQSLIKKTCQTFISLARLAMGGQAAEGRGQEEQPMLCAPRYHLEVIALSGHFYSLTL